MWWYVYSKKMKFLNDSYIADMFKEVDEIKQSIEEIKAKIDDIRILHKEKHTSVERHHDTTKEE